jgi:hypothetical protein
LHDSVVFARTISRNDNPWLFRLHFLCHRELPAKLNKLADFGCPFDRTNPIRYKKIVAWKMSLSVTADGFPPAPLFV